MMHRILPVLGLLVALFLVGYFGYRELTDPLLFARQKPPVEEAEPTTDTPGKEPSQPEVEPEEADQLQSELERKLQETQAVLAANMESRLLERINELETDREQRAEAVAAVRETVLSSLDDFAADTGRAVEALADTLDSLQQSRDELAAADEEMQEAREDWQGLFEDVADIRQFSEDAFNEQNYRFESYEVGNQETLSGIARKLEQQYGLTETDLGRLLAMFNDLTFRTVQPPGKRPSFQVVANDTLRIPIPQSAGAILEEWEVPEQLMVQMTRIERTRERHAALREALTKQEEQLADLRRNLQSLDRLAEDLQQRDLFGQLPREPTEGEAPELTEDQRAAWRSFNEAVNALSSAEDGETSRAARTRLEEATDQLLEAYRDQPDWPIEKEFSLREYTDFLRRYQPAD